MHPPSQLLLRHAPLVDQPGSYLIAPPDDELLGHFPQVSALFDDFSGYARWRDRSNVHFGLLPPENLAIERVFIFMPKAQAQLDWWLQLVAGLLPQGAEVYLVGENDAGIRGGAKRFSAALGGAHKIDSARHCQLWRASLQQSAARPDLVSVEKRVSVTVRGNALSLAALPGTFSAGSLDAGTALLLETLDSAPAGRLLDFGCGCGVIGTYLARLQPSARIVMLDSSASAVESARRTLALNGVAAEVVASDGFAEIQGQFSAIYSNPPFHQGVRTDYRVVEELIRQARNFLLPGGELRIVANSFLKYADLLQDVFGAFEVLADDGRFRVYRCKR